MVSWLARGLGRWSVIVVSILAAVVAMGCDRRGRLAGADLVGGEPLVVFAAASLHEAFTALSHDFKRARPGVDVLFNFAGTQELRRQLEQGAVAHVFAAADQRHVDELVRSGKLASPVTFALNEPVLVTSQGTAYAAGTDTEPAIHDFADLPKASRIVVGAPEVPIGRYTLAILDRASRRLGADFRSRVEAKVVSRELNVRQVLAKVALGEAEAGIVYRTDANTARDRVAVVAIPPDLNAIAAYPIAVVTGAMGPDSNHSAFLLARAWVELVLSAEGQRVLRAAGFLAPPADGSSP